MWQDENLFWAWRGDGKPTTPPPTKKGLKYVVFNEGTPLEMRICCTVCEDGVDRPINREQIAWHEKFGPGKWPELENNYNRPKRGEVSDSGLKNFEQWWKENQANLEQTKMQAAAQVEQHKVHLRRFERLINGKD
jgi:hypothetical protein